jgi:hypothetical protein
MTTGDEIKLWVAVIAAVASFVVAMISHFSSRSNQRKIERLRDVYAERDARRDYEYEARKRLYHECGPAFFQMMELSESAFHRITGLAGTARESRTEQPFVVLN